jgi:hypothetical protein
MIEIHAELKLRLKNCDEEDISRGIELHDAFERALSWDLKDEPTRFEAQPEKIYDIDSGESKEAVISAGEDHSPEERSELMDDIEDFLSSNNQSSFTPKETLYSLLLSIRSVLKLIPSFTNARPFTNKVIGSSHLTLRNSTRSPLILDLNAHSTG